MLGAPMDRLKRVIVSWWKGILIWLIVSALILLGALEGLERGALNTLFELRGPIVPRTPIVIVSIDEASFDELDLQWPWPRALHGKFLEIVSRGKPAAIGFDIVFPEPSARGPADDRALGDAVKRAGNVVLAAAFTRTRLAGIGTKEDLNPPIDVIRDGAAGVGFANFTQESDAFIRTALLAQQFRSQRLEGFDLHLYRLGAKAGIPAKPLPERDAILINFQGDPQTFPTIPYYRILNGEVAPEEFAGKIVLVGATSPILHDLFPTPFATSGRMPGVEIHANVLETLFQGIPLQRVPRALSLALVLAAALLATRLADRLRPLPGLAVVLLGIVGYGLICLAAFLWGRFWMEVMPVPAALVAGHAATTVQNFIREQRERRRLSRFFSPAVVAEVVHQKDDRQLGSSRRLTTVLFSDIRGFTSMSERMSPEDVASFLREYLTVMTDAVFKEGGTVDKYIGDAIMALWNVPFEQPDHAARAVRTALAFQERLKPLAARFQEKYGGDLRCGVGINTGDAVVGTIGSEQRLEYTAIGDTINLGSRLESITKDFKVPIVLSETTRSHLGQEFITRYLGEVKVKGKEIPVKIFTVEESSSRREPRIAVQGTVAIVEEEVILQAPLRDLSRGGLSVRDLPKDYPVGQVVRLELRLPSAGDVIPIAARAAWSKPGVAGFQFIEPPPDALKTIEDILSSSTIGAR
jgi:adenylate cyclase